jgi:hypothetical protein
VLPFVRFLPQTLGILNAKATNPNYGGISVLAVFNAASPRGSGWYFSFSTNLTTAAELLTVFRWLAFVAIGAGVLLVGYRLLRSTPPDGSRPFRLLLLGAQWAVAGVILSDPVPQPENLIALIPLGLLTLPQRSPRRHLAVLAALSGAGTLLYWAILTPLGMLYPLANLLGRNSVLWVNSVVLAYVHTPLLQGSLWLVAGLLGGASILFTWTSSGRQLMPWEALQARLGGWRGHEPMAVSPPV